MVCSVNHSIIVAAAFFISFLFTSSLAGLDVSPSPPPSIQQPGLPEECNALLRFKNSFKIKIVSKSLCKTGLVSSTKATTASWKEGTDCCAWDGITCDNTTGNVIQVYLPCSYLHGTLDSVSSIFSSLRHLQYFSLGGNDLSGPIPSSVCQRSSLVWLDLRETGLGGTIPHCLGDLTNLIYLDLSSNSLEGTLPRTLANCTSLQSLNVNENWLNDTFPFWLNSLPLEQLLLHGNNFHGLITSGQATFPFPHLDLLVLSNNHFHGKLPPDYFRFSNLSLINLSDNMFDGFLPNPPTTTEAYAVSNNRFTGEIPSSFCKITSLVLLRMSKNTLTGKIPQCLVDANVDLAQLDLSMNRFQGPIPEISTAWNCSLRSIVLSRNHLGGKLPRSLAKCKHLEVLDIGDNEVEDSFPSWIETLHNMSGFVIRANKFHGPVPIPKSIHPFPRLHIFDISNNNFDGIFPSQYITSFTDMMGEHKLQGSLELSTDAWIDEESVNMIYKGVPTQLTKIQKALVVIDISHNHFQGEIPEGIGNLQSLIGLNLSHNSFQGDIPPSLGNLTELEWLDLSANSFTGEIPTELTNMKTLAIFNVSNNQLKGQIPEGKQFATFEREFFDGNPDLCGHPLPKPCEEGHQAQQEPPSAPEDQDEDDAESWFEYRAVLMGLGCGIVIGLSTGYIFIETRGFPRWLINTVERKRTRRTRKPQMRPTGTHRRSTDCIIM